MLEDLQQPAVLTRLLRVVNADDLRSFAISVDFSPVHRFMFSCQGELLYANSRATAKWIKAGKHVLAGKS